MFSSSPKELGQRFHNGLEIVDSLVQPLNVQFIDGLHGLGEAALGGGGQRAHVIGQPHKVHLGQRPGNGVELVWDEAEDNFGIAYYRIEKNGRFLARVETFAGGELKFVDENGRMKDTYTVTAFDAAGNNSESAEV
jgi:hypothetical protein